MIGLLALAYLGMVFILIGDVGRSGVVWSTFKWSKWLDDNLWGVLAGAIAVPLTIITLKSQGLDLDAYHAISVGIQFQGLVAMWLDRKRAKKSK